MEQNTRQGTLGGRGNGLGLPRGILPGRGLQDDRPEGILYLREQCVPYPEVPWTGNGPSIRYDGRLKGVQGQDHKGAPDVADGLHLSEGRRVGMVLPIDHIGRLQPLYRSLGTLSVHERRGCQKDRRQGLGQNGPSGKPKAQAALGQWPLLHQQRAQSVHRGKEHEAYQGETEPSADTGKDRALSPFDEEHHQTGQLLSARGTQGKVGRVRGLLQ